MIRSGSTPRGPTWPHGGPITPDSRRSFPTRVPSMPRPSAPTARPSSPGATTHGAALGRRHRPARRPALQHQARSSPWRSAPTARPSSPACRTRRRGSGTPPPAGPSDRPSRIEGEVRAVAFSPDGKTFHGGTERRRGSGTPPPAGPSAEPFEHQSAVECRGVQPRRQDPPHRGQRHDRAALGRRHPRAPWLTPSTSEWPFAVAFSPDSKTVITGCGDGTVQLVGRGDRETRRRAHAPSSD